MTMRDEIPSEGNLPQLPELPGLAGLGSPRPVVAQENPGTGRLIAPVINQDDSPDSGSSIGIVAPETDQYLGKAFGGYRLEQKIGQGGMGTVFKGRQVSLDRVVAVKILNKALYENREFIKRFEREAKSIAKINHPNIVAVYDFGVHDGLWFMVNEFIEGQSLSKIISDRLVLPVAETITYIVHCLSGLAHVGSGNIVHRDIKPDNILITKDGIAKIADFGLAKDVSERSDATDLTAVGLAMGTPAYMSPEQCMGRKLDGRSDQYALGVTAYFALTGEKPFTGQSSFEIMTRQREHSPPAPHQLNPNVPANLSALVMKMIAKDPSDRFNDASVCREAWVTIGTDLGVFNNSRRSGEYEMPTGLLSATLGEPRKSARLRSDPALSAGPLAIQDAAPPVRPSERVVDKPAETRLPDVPPVPVARRPSTDAPSVPRTSGEWSPEAKSKERTQSERHRPSGQGGPSGQASSVNSGGTNSGALSCPRCGHLNRADAITCARCTAPMREAAPHAARDQEVEAQRLFDSGRHREAAAIYARLADKEGDKRARSILRAKEREARTIETERQVSDLTARARGMRDRGNIQGAIALLEQGQKLVGESPGVSTVSPGSDSSPTSAIAAEIAELRASVSGRKRNRVLLIVVVVLLMVATTVTILLWRLRLVETSAAPVVPASSAIRVIPAVTPQPVDTISVDASAAAVPAKASAP